MRLLRPTLSAAFAAGLMTLLAGPLGARQVFEKPILEDPDVIMAQLPPEVVGAGVIQRVDNQVPLEREFVDTNGRVRTLGSIIDGSVPVLLTLNYSDCPQLCSLVINGVIANLKEMSLEPGEDFKIITISINPDEDPARTKATKERYIQQYDREGAEESWFFLRGQEKDIRAVANAVGFGYVKVAGADPVEFSHPATLIVLTPDGHVSLYLTAIADDPQTVRLALVDASDGAIGGIADLFFTTCFHYDESRGKYAPIAKRLMGLGGAVFLVGFASLLITFRVLEKRRHAEETEQ
jgi:protein SCO1/2